MKRTSGLAALPRADRTPRESNLGLHRALTALRDDLGYDTASLFVPGPGGWELLDRAGPDRPWHAVLDPAVLGPEPRVFEYVDARSLPGVGGRLAGLGCGSVASLPLPEGGCVVFDASGAAGGTGWIERARPYLALMSTLAGPPWAGGGSLRTREELGAIQRVFAVCQKSVERAGDSPSELVEDVRRALGAHELHVLAERGLDVEVVSAPSSTGPRRLVGEAPALLGAGEPHDLTDARLAAVALRLGIPAMSMATAPGGRPRHPELVVAVWSDGVLLSDPSMTVVARTVSTSLAALAGRGHAVSAQVDRDRARLAFALHDGLIQSVTSAVLELEALPRRFEGDPAQALATLEESKNEIRRSLAELRSLLFDLSGTGSIEPPSQPLARSVEDVVKRWRLPATVTVEGNVDDVPPRVQSVAYMVIREALANAAKHASAGNVTVTVAANGGDLAVIVADGGKGFTSRDEQAAREAHHFGLDMLRRRVREVGGELVIDSTIGTGTRVMARLPLREVGS